MGLAWSVDGDFVSRGLFPKRDEFKLGLSLGFSELLASLAFGSGDLAKENWTSPGSSIYLRSLSLLMAEG